MRKKQDMTNQQCDLGRILNMGYTVYPIYGNILLGKRVINHHIFRQSISRQRQNGLNRDLTDSIFWIVTIFWVLIIMEWKAMMEWEQQ